ncbi:M20/M25/M40 family metallo-hydrolase [Candidatus Collierbacteria bacterium]|nr:M20/M25/M40 family metallo-hydrolase [Candidatus Collierbacteria bacterium]
MLDKQTFIDRLTQLVGRKTLPGDLVENARALDLVIGWIDKKAIIKRVQNGKAEILIAGNADNLSPDFAFMVHMDIVAGKPEQFKMVVDGDRLIGRGTSDMKFSVPMGIALLNEIISTNSKQSFALVITTDEEIGGPEGAKYLVEVMKYSPKVLIVPDGGDNLIFVDKAKGVCQINIHSTGSPAHASRPWLGKNALEPLVLIAAKLIEEFGTINKKESWLTTMNIGVIQGGISTNQVCPEAVMKLDFRFPETERIERILEKVRKLSREVGNEVTVELSSTGQPTFTDKNLPVVKKFIKALEGAAGRKIEVRPTYGASDARWFANLDVPVLMIKPIGGGIHSDTEWVSLSSCLKFYDGLKNFLFGLQ